MSKKFDEIYNKIKEFDKIVIARHIGADIDALGSTLGLKEIITNTFPKKKVSVVGAYSSVFKYMGKMDKLDEKEAKWIMKKIKDYKVELEIVYDWENWGDFQEYDLSFYGLKDSFQAFRKTVEKKGYQGML